MHATRGTAVLITLSALLLVVLVLPSTVEAETGTIKVSPGETKYVSFGVAAEDDLLLWSLDIYTWSTVFDYWLEKPDGTRLSVGDYWGSIVDTGGEWKLGFSIAPEGFWSATVNYEIYNIRPNIMITSPENGAFVNATTILISGTVDDYANTVSVSSDGVHYQSADLYLGRWNKQLSLGADGEYTIIAEETIYWGTYWAKYYDEITITVDTVSPTVVIVTPEEGSTIRGNYVDLSWQCSDDNVIAKTEMKIDGWGWSIVQGYEYENLKLATGQHTIQIRVTDEAGNQATSSVTFKIDARALSFSGPYYGLPLVAIIVAIILVALFVVLRFARKPSVSPPTPPLEPPPVSP